MKRTLLWCMVLTLMLSFCGCKSSGGNGTTPSESTEPSENETSQLCYDGTPVTINFAYNNGRVTLLDHYVAEFQKLYPSITVNAYNCGDIDDICEMVYAMKNAKTYPNLVVCGANEVKAYMDWNVIAPLDEMMGSTALMSLQDDSQVPFGLTDAQKADFVDEFLAEGSNFGDGKTYMLPMSRYAQVMYYNKEFFDAHDLDVPATWEEMEAVCQQILQIDPDSTPLLLSSSYLWFYDLCMQNGVDASTAEGSFGGSVPAQILKKVWEGQQKQYLTVEANVFGQFSGEAYAPRGYMAIDASYGASYFYSGFEVGIAPVPKMDETQNMTLTNGTSLCILKKENEQEMLASWLLMKYLTTNIDFQAERSMLGGHLPVIESVTQHPDYSVYLNSADGTENLEALSVKTCMGMGGYYPYITESCYTKFPTVNPLSGFTGLLYTCMKADEENIDSVIAAQLQLILKDYQ